jgi:hypothetical protein
MHGLGSHGPIRKERTIFVEMAQTWLAAAARLEPGLAESIEKNVGNGGAPIHAPDGRHTAWTLTNYGTT